LASIKNLQGFHYKYPLSCRFIKAHSSYIIRIYIRYRLFKGRLFTPKPSAVRKKKQEQVQKK